MNSKHGKYRSKRQAERRKNFILSIVMIILAAAAVCFIIVAKKASDSREEVSTEQIDDVSFVSTNYEDVVIFGVDSRTEEVVAEGEIRADSIMIVHIDYDAEEIKVVSIYRDTLVKIEGGEEISWFEGIVEDDAGYDKLTHSYSYGGPDLSMTAINENFDLDIDDYVAVNFITVADLVDELGGIEQDITEAEVEYINGYIDEVNEVRGTASDHIEEAGTYTLDGTQAVAFSRIRYTSGGDYERTERQRMVLFKVFEKASDLDSDSQLSMVSDLIEEIETSYNLEEIVNVMYSMQDYEITDMSAFPEVFYGGTVEEIWVEVPITLIDMNASIHEFLYNETDYEPSETVENISDFLLSLEDEANNDMREEEEDS